jgi:hypothetical protein
MYILRMPCCGINFIREMAKIRKKIPLVIQVIVSSPIGMISKDPFH